MRLVVIHVTAAVTTTTRNVFTCPLFQQIDHFFQAPNGTKCRDPMCSRGHPAAPGATRRLATPRRKQVEWPREATFMLSQSSCRGPDPGGFEQFRVGRRLAATSRQLHADRSNCGFRGT